MMTRKTKVGIVGAGPSGLFLAHILRLEGIDSVVVENRARQYVEERVRAGVLEQGTIDMLIETGVGERLKREGLIHHGFELRFNGEGHRIDMHKLTGGRCIAVYGQSEVVRDLADAHHAAGGEIHYEAGNVAIEGFDTNAPSIRYSHDGVTHKIACDFIAGCDGFHGICRPAIPSRILKFYDKVYPFGWLGILSDAVPSAEELIYANHPRGFALHSMRSASLTRLYLQVEPDEPVDAWPDSRIWEELDVRLQTKAGFRLTTGNILQKSITPMRSFVTDPMQCGRLFLAGDSAHIVPPTGAKGLNLAVADVRVLSRALVSYYRTGSASGLDGYSSSCLRRIWRAQHFSWWMTSMLHRFSSVDDFDHRRQLAELDNITSSESASRNIAENYSGLPFAD